MCHTDNCRCCCMVQVPKLDGYLPSARPGCRCHRCCGLGCSAACREWSPKPGISKAGGGRVQGGPALFLCIFWLWTSFGYEPLLATNHALVGAWAWCPQKMEQRGAQYLEFLQTEEGKYEVISQGQCLSCLAGGSEEVHEHVNMRH